jgi:hypothetical protein
LLFVVKDASVNSAPVVASVIFVRAAVGCFYFTHY